jgi:hypothetical protein
LLKFIDVQHGAAAAAEEELLKDENASYEYET